MILPIDFIIYVKELDIIVASRISLHLTNFSFRNNCRCKLQHFSADFKEHAYRNNLVSILLAFFKMIVTRAISLTNFLVASSALGFQVFVLYPWHKQLDESFEGLKKDHGESIRRLETVLHLRRGASSTTSS
jgi:hypothetical protein